MRYNVLPNQTTGVVPGKIRLLSIATGSFTAIGGSLVIGIPFLIPPIILVFGAIAQPYFRVVGKWFIGLGAVLLSAEVMVLAAVIPESVRLLRLYHDRNFVATLSFSIVSVLLVAWLDLALIIYARQLEETPPTT